MNSRFTYPAFALLLCLIAGLAACASSGASSPEPGAESSKAAVVPAAVAQPEDEDRACLRVLLIQNPVILGQAARRLDDGEDFITIARSLVKEHPDQVSDRTICTGSGELDPALAKAAEDLELGESAGPITLGQGGALVRATTDRWFKQGRAEMRAGNHHLAEEALQKDLELNPDNVSSWHLLGLSRMARGDWPRGLEALELGLAWAPKDSALINDIGSALWELGRREEAMERYQQALALSPQNPLLMNNLAWALAEQGRDLEQAEALVRKALDIAPEQAAFWDTLGQVMEAQKRPSLAVIAYHHALALDPERPGTKRRMLVAVTGLNPDQVSRLAVGEDLAPARLAQAEKAFQSTVVRPSPLPPARVELPAAPSPPPAVKRFLDSSAGEADATAQAKQPQAEPMPVKREQTVASAGKASTSPVQAPAPPPVKETPEPLPLLEGQPVLNAPTPQPGKEGTGSVGRDQAADSQLEAASGQDQVSDQQARAERAGTMEEAASLAEPEHETKGETAGEVEERPEAVEKAASQVESTPEPEATEEQGDEETGSAWLRRWMGADQNWTPSGKQGETEAASPPVQAETQKPTEPEPASGARVVLKESGGGQRGEQAQGPGPAVSETKKTAPAPETTSPPPPETRGAVEEAGPPPPRIAPGLAGWYVQVSSYRTLALAKKEYSQWQTWSWGCQLEHIDMGPKGKWYRVMLGPYTSKGEARRVGRNLVKEGIIKEYMIRDKTRD